MRYKLYLLHIGDLEDMSLQDTAMTLIDNHRKEIVQKKKREKDRMLAIAAGLLLQAGFLELEPTKQHCDRREIFSDSQTLREYGMCYKLTAKALVESMQKYSENGRSIFPIPLIYKTGSQGKPFWDREVLQAFSPEKRLWYFNLSHSGDYAALAVADCAVGVDIQEPRKAEKIPGGYRGFSRLEAYVKCTGAGYAYGHREYENARGNVPGYPILSFDLIEEYALHICFADGKEIENVGAEGNDEK
ncbi:MAG: hypothetical protein IJZ84_03700 [Lachnospiraceae bacterium]|nr:hypothetical protein [Lachnospiraceae bacterium]